MNYIWCIMIIFAIVCSFFTGTVEETTNAAFDGAKNSLSIILSVAPLLCFWSGIMSIAQKSGTINAIKKLMSPIINRLFKNESDKAKEYITANICANMLGMGNAATPVGIEAMNALQKTNPQKDRPSSAMCLFMVLNTTCLCLVPSTVLSLRSAALSHSPTSVIIYVWIVSIVTVVVSASLVKICIKDNFSV